MIKIPNQKEIRDGQAIYTKKNLILYDLIVTRLSNRFAWKCPRKVLIKFYQEHISGNHLDIGVGTGYFLDKTLRENHVERIGLLDLNSACLQYAKHRLNKFNVELYHHDVFKPFTGINEKFDSISLNYVIHCLPGTLLQKAIVFDNIKAVLNSNGVLFGSTLLGKINKNKLADKLLALYNQKKIMHNLADDAETLEQELKNRFSYVQIKINGCVALFVAKN